MDQATPGTFDEAVRLAVYRQYATTGTAPAHDELAKHTGATAEQVSDALHRLAADRHLVLDGAAKVIMAHPFASIPLGFSVMGRATLWWGGCSWDSFAIPHLVPEDPEVLVSTRCPHCGAPLAWVVGTAGPPPGDEVAHFLVPMASAWDDVLKTCGNQRIFCSTECVQGWLEVTGRRPGSTMDLPTLWHLAEHWYDGRLDPGYVRREPSQAQAYFREVGLAGAFWGLD